MKRARLILRLSQILLRKRPLGERLRAFLQTLLSEPSLSLESKGAIFVRRGNSLLLAAEHRLDEPLKRLCAEVRLGQCLCGRVGLSGRPLVAEGVGEAHEIRYPGMPPHGHLILPLKAGRRILGVLNLYQAPGARPSPEARATLEEAAGLLALALMREQAERAARVLRRAAELSLALRGEPQYLEGVCALLVHEGYPLAWVGEALPDGRVQVLAGAGAVGYLEGLVVRWDETPEGQGPTGRAIRLGRPQVLRNVGSDPSYGPWRQRAKAFGILSSAAFPLRIGESIFGALNVYAHEEDAFEREEMDLLLDLARLVGEAVRRFRAEARSSMLAQVVEQVPESIFLTDLSGRITYANPALARQTGYTPKELLGKTPRIFKSGRHSEAFYKELWQTLERGEVFSAVFWNRAKDGRFLVEDKILTPLRDPEGRVVAYASTGREVTQAYVLSRIEAALKGLFQGLLEAGMSRALLQTFLQEVLEAIPGAEGLTLLLKGEDGLFRFAVGISYDREILSTLELLPEEALALAPEEPGGAEEVWRLWPGEKRALAERALRLGEAKESLAARLRVEGEVAGILRLDAFQAPLSQGASEAFQRVAQALETALSLEAAQARARYLAYHDPVTGLPNLALLREEAPDFLGEGSWALILVKLESLFRIVQTYGREARDQVLKALSQRFKGLLPPGGRLYRTQGEEFLFLVPMGPEKVGSFFRKVKEAIGEPLALPQGQVWLGAKAGVALSPGDGREVSLLLRKADLALDRAFKEQKELVFFDPELEAGFRRRFQLEEDLARALREGALVFFAQPIVRLDTGEPAAYELLLRWPREGGYLPASEFIPLAEETGLIVELDLYVLRRIGDVLLERPLHVNLSPQTLLDPRLLPLAAEVAARWGSQRGGKPLPVCIEVTEYALAKPEVAQILEGLKALGFSLALDDYGQGYASLNALVQYHFDLLKVDKVFVQQIGQNPKAEMAVRTTAMLAKGLGLDCVAEGVETEEQRAWLRAVGYHLGQGYLFGRPGPLSGAAGFPSPGEGLRDRR